MKNIIILILTIIVLPVLATEASLELIDHYGYSQSYFSSHDHIIIDEPYLYTITRCSMQIFEIQENGTLECLSILPFKVPNSFVKHGDYLYIITFGPSYPEFDFVTEPSTIYQVNVSNPSTPIIENAIQLSYSESTGVGGYKIGNYLQVYNVLEGSELYTLPDLEYVATLPQSPLPPYYLTLHELTDEIAIHISMPNNTLYFYEFSDINNIQYLNEIDMSDIHNPTTSSITYFTRYSEDVVMVNNQFAISFWDITDPVDWQYITHYEFDFPLSVNYRKYSYIDDHLLILMKQNGLELLDISDIYNPQVLDHINIYVPVPRQPTVHEDIIYATLTDYIHVFELNRDEMQIEFREIHFDYPTTLASTSKFYDHYLVINSDWYYTTFGSAGVYFYDIQDPHNPQIIYNELYENEYYHINIKHDLLILSVMAESLVEIYDISNLPEVELLAEISTEPIVHSKIRIDEYEDDTIYIYRHYPNSILRKYDISDPRNPELLFEFEHPVGYTILIHNGYGYLYERNEPQNTQNLYIIDGLFENDPSIANSHMNFVNHAHASPTIVNDYLFHRDYNTIIDNFYSLENPTEPTVQFSIQTGLSITPYTVDYYDGILFITTSAVRPIQLLYDIGDSPNGIIDSFIFGHETLHGTNNMHFLETGPEVYAFSVNRDHLSLYELNITPISADEPAILPPEVTFANFPNPFNTETTFAINLPQIDEDAVIELYNIKGQLVRKLEVSPSEDSVTHITWDGRDNRGRVVASGIYLAKLRNGSETQTHRVVLLK
jgi:hypothetical protein